MLLAHAELNSDFLLVITKCRALLKGSEERIKNKFPRRRENGIGDRKKNTSAKISEEELI